MRLPVLLSRSARMLTHGRQAGQAVPPVTPREIAQYNPVASARGTWRITI